MARQDSRHRGPEESRDAKNAYSLKASTAKTRLMRLWRNTGGKALSGWPEEMLQRQPQSLSEGFRITNGVLGTDCTGAIKVAR